jgi:hypothetical protein
MVMVVEATFVEDACDRAVITAVPVVNPFTTPALDTEATSGADVSQVTAPFAVPVTAALSCASVPTVSVAGGATIETMIGGRTLTCACDTADGEAMAVAVIVADPAETPVTTPDDETAAT